jgi:hypothetical protein
LKKLALAFLAIATLPLQLNGQSLNARFSTSLYSYERNLTNSTAVNYMRLYQTAQLTVGQFASNRLSFHLFGQVSQDLAESADDDPIPRLYNAYFQWQERNALLSQVKLGRQRVYSGVAYGAIDGLDLTVRAGNHFKIGGFAGFLVPTSNEIEVASWDASHAFGLRASTDQILGAKMLVSFYQRNRQQVSYTNGRFTSGLLPQARTISFQSLEQRLIGIDVYRSVAGRANVYGRFDYDLLNERVRRGQFELRVSPTQKLELAGEFFHRAPLIGANSIFSVFDQSTSQDFGLRANYRVNQTWFVDGNLGYQMYDGDESLRFGLGLRFKYGYFGYNFRRGYGGQNNGAYASLNYQLNSKIGLTANTGLSRYSLFDDDGDDHTSITGSVGVNYRPHKLISVDVVGQALRNRFLSNDMRLFARANYWFFTAKKK